MNPKLENEQGWKITQENYDAGWRLWTDEQPPSESHFYTYDYYDGPHYHTFYITKDRQFFDSVDIDGPLEDINEERFFALWHPLVEYIFQNNCTFCLTKKIRS